MGKSSAIFRRDMKRILHNPVALVIALGICVVPCLYAWINILANWDPYENTSDMPVAVVNEDKPVKLDDLGTICTGDMLVEALEENDKIGWTFVDEKTALEGVRSGDIYAAIVIPEDFTQTLTGILDGKVEKAHLKYYVNEKVNAIAPKVTDTGASTIETQIDNQFVATVGKVVTEKLGGVAGRLSAGSKDAVDDAATSLDKVHVTLVKVDAQLGDLSSSLAAAQKALSDASKAMSSFEGKGKDVGTKIETTLEGFADTRANANNLMTDINAALDGGVHTISSLSSQASYDVSSLAGDIALAQSQVNAAIRALERDLSDNEALVAKVNDAHDLIVNINPADEQTEATRIEIERQLADERDLLLQISDQQTAKLDELRGLAQRLEAAANEVANLSNSLDSKMQGASKAMLDAQAGAVSTSLLEVNNALDSFVQVAKQLESAMKLVDPVVSETVSVTKQLSDTLGETDSALSATRTSIQGIAQSLDSLANELAAIRASEAWSLLTDLSSANPQLVHDFMVAPVEINEKALFPVENYASGIAPFFTSLALWVGGIALVAIFKLEVDEEGVGKIRPWQAYFGRWMLFVVLGLLQAIVCCTGDLLIGIQCVYPWAFYLSAIVASFVFVNIIFSLSVAFKHFGKALAFTLIILQVPGSAGMYPIEMMPSFFQAINPWLPFTYSNNALREAVAGFYGSNLAYNLFMLLLFVIPAILLGVTARSHLINVNALVDRRLRETDHLMVSEPVAIEGNRYRLATVVKAIHCPQEYHDTFEQRSRAFEKSYPALVRRGLLALLVVPLVLFGFMLLFDANDAKLPLLACLVVSLLVIGFYLVLVEYFHDRIEHKMALTDLSGQELEGLLQEALREEVLPSVPIDAILERQAARPDLGASVAEFIRQRREARAAADTAPDDEPSKGGDEQ